MRKKLVAGNWKSFLHKSAAEDLLKELRNKLSLYNLGTTDVAVFPPSIYIEKAVKAAEGAYTVGAQNCSQTGEGAFTGEISAAMLSSVGAQFVLAGHSERRQLFGETNAVVREKVTQILAAKLTPVFCCGETLDIRNAGTHTEYVLQQLSESVFHLNNRDFSKLIIAYEPVWAIGTGVNANPEQAQEMHAFIRNAVRLKYSDDIAESLQILYGGSVKPDNAKSLFTCTDVDGGLVGGASLKATDFISIIQSASN